MKIKIFVLTGLIAAASAGRAQQGALDRGYRQMYDLQFAEAHQTFQEYQRLHPEDPMGPVSDAAAYLFSELDRLHILQSEFFTHDQHFITDHKLSPDAAAKARFTAALEASRKLSARTPAEPTSQLASILSDGLESNYLALIEKRYTAALQKTKGARNRAERLLQEHPAYYDAWIAVGVENYMLSLKPLALRFFLRLGGAQTSRAYGIEKLRITAEKGRYLAPFAKLLLAVAALRDQDTPRARALLAELTRDFPRNPLYRQELARLEPLAMRTTQ